MSFTLAEWLKSKLKNAPPEILNSSDFPNALEQLAQGRYSSLLIEMDGSNESSEYENNIKCKDLVISPEMHRVTRNGKDLALTPKEFDILYFLAKNRGEVFTKEQIYNAVWDDKYLLDDSNIMAFIRKLRKKIEPNPDAPEYIITIWGIGYKFNENI